eukprot:TRINITY_DN107085_c0_g1_i1.p1 TRINITY_DN107085_c0_g1~~TRINITY_DN107085_c0_g1_i1.p1  ORF type:complete len:404 (-),score=77.12 TRINITY_DN107085_c0_g1_i1:367-1578(-)
MADREGFDGPLDPQEDRHGISEINLQTLDGPKIELSDEMYEKYKFLAMPSRSSAQEPAKGKPKRALNQQLMAGEDAAGEFTGNESDVTTIMMRNLPNKYTQQMLLEEVDQAGFAGSYDFFYLPIDPETRANRGYAFLDFKEPATAARFKQCFEGQSLRMFKSSKIVTITPAQLQGFEANYKHYSSSRVNRGDHSRRPLFFREPSGELGGAKVQAPARKQREPRGPNTGGGKSGRGPLAEVFQEQKKFLEERRFLQDDHSQRQRPEPQYPMDPGLDAVQAQIQQQQQMLLQQHLWCNQLEIERSNRRLGMGLAADPYPERFQSGTPEPEPVGGGVNFCPFCGEVVEKKQHRFCQFCGGNFAMQDAMPLPQPRPIPHMKGGPYLAVAGGFPGHNDPQILQNYDQR